MPAVMQDKVIDGHTYVVSQLPGMRGVLLFHRLATTCAPALARVAEVLVTSGADNLEDLPIAPLAAAIQVLGEKLGPKELEGLIKELLATATVDGQPLLAAFDLHFQGRALAVYKVLAFSFEVNFGDFRGAVVSMIASAKAAADVASAEKAMMMAQVLAAAAGKAEPRSTSGA